MVEKISFFRSYYESIKGQDPETYKEALNAIFAYVFDEVDIDLDGLSPSARMFCILVKPYVDSSLKKSASGKQGGSRTEANEKQTESKSEANEKQKPSNKNKKENKNIEVEIEGVNTTRAYAQEKLLEQFSSPELAQTFDDWVQSRNSRRELYPPAAMSDDLAKAKAGEKQYGAQAVMDVLKASFGYLRPVWDRLGRSQPKARSGTENGTDYLLRRIAEEEAKEAGNG